MWKKYRSRPPDARTDAQGAGDGPVALDRLSIFLGMIHSENRYPLFGIMPYERPRPARNFLMIGDRNERRGFLVSGRPVSRCAICRNTLVAR